jgi:CopG antitoxin of type II toxin-antitoxin system
VKGSDMPRNKSSISRARSYREIGEFWEVHDLSDFWSKTKKVKFDVDIASEVTYYPIERDLAEKIQSLARTRGVSPDTLVNLWLEQNQRKGILK